MTRGEWRQSGHHRQRQSVSTALTRLSRVILLLFARPLRLGAPFLAHFGKDDPGAVLDDTPARHFGLALAVRRLEVLEQRVRHVCYLQDVVTAMGDVEETKRDARRFGCGAAAGSCAVGQGSR